MSTPMSPFRHTGEEFSPAEWGRAWAVHLFTTLGIVAAMLALRDVLVDKPGTLPFYCCLEPDREAMRGRIVVGE